MPGFGDSAFLIVLALLLFGPKKLPELARQLGKLMADFRRASNEFRTQMEEELRISEQADRQKQAATLQADAIASAVNPIPTPEPSILPPSAPSFVSTSDSQPEYESESTAKYMVDSPLDPVDAPFDATSESSPQPATAPPPIAVSGDLSILPPSTGLPTPSSSPTATDPAHETELETETLHG